MKRSSKILSLIGIALCICAIGIAREKFLYGGAGNSGDESLTSDVGDLGVGGFDGETSVSRQRAKWAKQREERKSSKAITLIHDWQGYQNTEKFKELAAEFQKWSERDVSFAK